MDSWYHLLTPRCCFIRTLLGTFLKHKYGFNKGLTPSPNLIFNIFSDTWTKPLLCELLPHYLGLSYGTKLPLKETEVDLLLASQQHLTPNFLPLGSGQTRGPLHGLVNNKEKGREWRFRLALETALGRGSRRWQIAFGQCNNSILWQHFQTTAGSYACILSGGKYPKLLNVLRKDLFQCLCLSSKTFLRNNMAQCPAGKQKNCPTKVESGALKTLI